MSTPVEVDYRAIKKRIREILIKDPKIYYEKTGKTTAKSVKGKEGYDVYFKLREVLIGEPDDYSQYPTPYAFITNAPQRENDRPAGQVVGGLVQSSQHDVRVMIVVIAQEKSRADTETTLDVLHKLIKERLKAFLYLQDPEDTSDRLVAWAFPTTSDNFAFQEANDDRTYHGFYIILSIRKFTGVT